MAAHNQKEAVCVTGANGFIGSWLVRTLLESGYTTIHASIFPGSDPSHLLANGSHVVVYEADVLDLEAVCKAVEGCQGVFHVASPCTLEDPKDPQNELVLPAVQGTLNVLEAAKRHRVRRVVLTSSISALVPNPSWTPHKPFDESSWTDLHYCQSRQKWYPVSKTLAEKASWEFAEKHGIDIVAILPATCLGPLLQPGLNASCAVLLQLLEGSQDTQEYHWLGVVHVRDVAKAHLLLFETPAASGRYLCTNGIYQFGDFAERVSRLFPEFPVHSVADGCKVAEELKRADVVVFTYACDEPATLQRLSTFWLPKLSKLEVKVPVIVVGCKLDLRDENQKVSLEQVMSPIMKQFPEIETCFECSARLIQNLEVFYYAQTAVLYPRGPLLDRKTQALKSRCVRALKRIFILCDRDRDGALSDAELNDLQVKCYNTPMQPSEIAVIKSIVAKQMPEGLDDCGLTFMGFLFLHAQFINRGHAEAMWTVLKKFGYDNDIKLAEDLILTSFKRAPDQSVELTIEATEYLRGIFEWQKSHTPCVTSDGVMGPDEIDDIFSTAAESPWEREPYVDAAPKNAFGGLSLDGFLSMWDFMTFLDPTWSMENLIYVGYPGHPLSAYHVTRKRRLDRKKQQTDRNVFQCFVFGPTKAGKSALLNSFIGRSFSDKYTSTGIEDHYAVNIVDEPRGTKKTLVLREIPEEGVSKLLLDKESLAACDVAVFVHDSSNAFSWEIATELLEEVASHGKDTGFDVPCLIVAAKDDLVSFPMAAQNYIRVSRLMRIKAPICISSKLGHLNNVFHRIVSAAVHPHLSIPLLQARPTPLQKRSRLALN